MADLETPSFNLDAPGSHLYDGLQAAAGRRLNRFGNGFKVAANREAYSADPEAYLAAADLTEEERQAIRTRDWRWLVAHGGHVQAMQRIASIDGHYLFHVAAGAIGMDAADLIAACPRRVTGLGGIDG
jgi:protocatechuate 4,5-dioxygenase alpha subunit